MPSYFQLVLGAVSIINTLGKETSSMTRTIMKAVGAVAAGRNRKVHMKTVSVTIYCDEGSKGSNPATPTKATDNQWLFLFSDTFRTNYI